MRPYNAFEAQNVKFLVDNQVDFATIQITETGIRKSIMDATAPVRAYLKERNIHDYEKQPQGQENKRYITTYMMCETTHYATQTSLYRPFTKKGDPRLWVNKVKGVEFLHANDIFTLIAHKGILYAINISTLDIKKVCNSLLESPLKDLITEISTFKSSASKELLGLIQDRMSDWIPTDITADTAIGRKVESILGIDMNSSKNPDYKGIEIKSHRKDSKVRNTLFTQSPNWNISKLKSGKAIVDKYGYQPEGYDHKTLHVTLSSKQPNQQGLYLAIENQLGILNAIECCLIPVEDGKFPKVNDVAAWTLIQLHERLLTKHRETFWIDAESKNVNGQEFFRCTRIMHTKNPIPSQFDILLEQGLITIDMLLCRNRGGDTYSFKTTKKGRDLLFPQNEVYYL